MNSETPICYKEPSIEKETFTALLNKSIDILYIAYTSRIWQIIQMRTECSATTEICSYSDVLILAIIHRLCKKLKNKIKLKYLFTFKVS